MHIRSLTKSDFDFLLSVVDDWWGWPTRQKLHPVYLYQFGDTAFVAEEEGNVIGFVVGFISQTDPLEAYVHLVATAPSARRRGVASSLYKRFFVAIAERGCQRVKAIMMPVNHRSVTFHLRMGFRMMEIDTIEIEGLQAVKDYSGPGQHRVVLIRDL
jgi:predicted GNAT superfamily acetyltransferase